MKKSNKLLIVLITPIIITLICALLILPEYGPRFGIYIIPPNVELYGKIALSLIDQSGLYTNNEKWTETYEQCLLELKDAEKYEDTYKIIRKALLIGGGKHSFLKPKEEIQDTADSNTEKPIMPSVRIKNGIVTVKLPEFVDGEESGKRYAETVEEFIHQHKADITGVIIDLCDNNGGDCGPMITAVSALIPDGDLMYYHYSNYDIPINLKEGILSNAGSGGESLYSDEKISVPIAVLTNENTASSAEILLICFRGLENVKTFGIATAGYTSVNQTFLLYDGAQMNLTVASIKSRTGEVFENEPIEPDVLSKDPMTDVLKWLKE